MPQLFQGDCLKLMENIPDRSVDMILCDLPYGTTDCKWDSIIPFEPLWKQYRRIIKVNGNIVLFSVQPFTTALINSNLKEYRYSWYWKKNNVTGAGLAKKQPLRCIEDINVFTKLAGTNNKGKFLKTREYLQSERAKTGLNSKQIKEILKSSMGSHYFTNGEQFALPKREAYKRLQTTGRFKKPYEELVKLYKSEAPRTEIGKNVIYYPQGLTKLDKPIIKKPAHSSITSGFKNASVQTHTGYPKNLLEFKNEVSNNINRLHPTQKPVALLEYLIKTYTNAEEIVLDNCMGSGSTGVACVNTSRKFIGIELDKGYFNIAQERINKAIANKH